MECHMGNYQLKWWRWRLLQELRFGKELSKWEMTMSHAARQMIKLKEVTRQFSQGLSGQNLFTISNKDLGIKDRSMKIKLTDTYRNHLWLMQYQNLVHWHGVILRATRLEMGTAGCRLKTHILGLIAWVCSRISVVGKDIWEIIFNFKKSKEFGLVRNVKWCLKWVWRGWFSPICLTQRTLLETEDKLTQTRYLW